MSKIETLKAKEQELKAAKKAVKDAQKLKEWEAKTKERNPSYVMGSVRQATEADVAELGHTHGQICTIVCSVCGKERVINKQDAFQVRFCKDCRKKAKQETAKERRVEKKLSSTSVDEVEAEIKRLEAELAKLAA